MSSFKHSQRHLASNPMWSDGPAGIILSQVSIEWTYTKKIQIFYVKSGTTILFITRHSIYIYNTLYS